MVIIDAEPAGAPAHTIPLSDVVSREVDHLHAIGLDVAVADPDPRYTLDAEVQRRVSTAIEERAGREGFVRWLFDERVHPSGAAWHGVAKRAIALHTLYHVGDLQRPGEGIDEGAYDVPLLAGGRATARELILAEQAGERGERILQRYDRFLAAGPMSDHQDEYGLDSRDYLTGVIDAHAVRTRAQTAKTLLHEHFAGSDRPLRFLSIACGIAGAIFDYVHEAAGGGVVVDELTFVDHDPLALATTVALARTAGLDGVVRPLRKNLLKTAPASYVSGQVDMVDLVGVFEHLPSGRLGHRVASSVLAAAAEVVRPGGLVLLGNMLGERPQQRFFDSVWPRLSQRTIRQVLALAGEAGFPAHLVKVRVPAREGVYAVYALTVPERRGRSVRENVMQRAIAKALFARLPEY